MNLITFEHELLDLDGVPGRCDFCGAIAMVNKTICHRDRCRWHQREVQQDLEKLWRRERRMAFYTALRDRCRDEISCNWLRWFYTIKTVICIFFRLQPNKRDCNARHIGPVGMWGYGRDYYGEAYGQQVVVGPGFFNNWYYMITGI